MSKILLLSGGSTESSGNKKAAQYAMSYLQEKKIETRKISSKKKKNFQFAQSTNKKQIR